MQNVDKFSDVIYHRALQSDQSAHSIKSPRRCCCRNTKIHQCHCYIYLVQVAFAIDPPFRSSAGESTAPLVFAIRNVGKDASGLVGIAIRIARAHRTVAELARRPYRLPLVNAVGLIDQADHIPPQSFHHRARRRAFAALAHEYGPHTRVVYEIVEHFHRPIVRHVYHDAAHYAKVKLPDFQPHGA